MTSLTAVLIVLTPVFLLMLSLQAAPASAAEDDLERAGIRSPGEDVVRCFKLIQAEVVVHKGSHGCLHVFVKFCSPASSRRPDLGRAEGPYRSGLKVMTIPDGRNFTGLTWAAKVAGRRLGPQNPSPQTFSIRRS